MKQRFVLLAMLVFTFHVQADIIFLATATIPGDASDLSGLTGKLDDGTPRNRLGSLGSGIAYMGTGNRYLLISDRGPKDGATDFPCRWHALDITMTAQPKPTLTAKLTSTTLLSDESGKTLNGSSKAFDPKKPMRFDPEAIRVGPEGTIFLADEYGPAVCEFDATGKRVKSFTIPNRYEILKPSGNFLEEMPPFNTVGRQPNRGFEGLAISPDGKTLFALLQGPLMQDGALGAKNSRTGHFCRLVVIDRATDKTRELVYPLDNPDTKAGEILAINDHEFLVLEGDSNGGKETKFKKVMHVDIKNASDVSAIDSLPASKLPATIKPVQKKLFIDLLDAKHKLAGPKFPAKIEGIAFGPDLPDGRHLLLVTSDNDFLAEFPLEIYAFAINKSDLPNFQPQRFPTK